MRLSDLLLTSWLGPTAPGEAGCRRAARWGGCEHFRDDADSDRAVLARHMAALRPAAGQVAVAVFGSGRN